MCNKMTTDKVFYATLAPFLAFYAAFSFVLYPARALIHPDATCMALAEQMPNLAAPLAVVCAQLDRKSVV